MTPEEVDELARRARAVLFWDRPDGMANTVRIGDYSFLPAGGGIWVLHRNQYDGDVLIFAHDLKGKRVVAKRFERCRGALGLLRQHQLLDDLAEV